VRPLATPLLMLLAITLVGTLGYIQLEGWPPLESFYQVVITLSTVGFKEVSPLSTSGRVLTILIIVFGIGAVTYLVRRIVAFTVEGEMAGLRRRKKMNHSLERIKDHYLICGYGRVGKWAVEEFLKESVPVVVIDDNPDLEPDLQSRSLPYVIGDASSDDVLRRAGVTRALGLIAVTDTDAENVFVAMSACALNPDIRVISRANDAATEAKLRRAGVEGVICPLQIAGSRIASMLLHPATTGFLDIVTRRGEDELRIQDLPIREGSPLAGLTIQGADIRAKSGSMVLGIRRHAGQSELNPSPSSLINPGDRLIVLGTRTQLSVLENMI